jgi:hypothetical protein
MMLVAIPYSQGRADSRLVSNRARTRNARTNTSAVTSGAARLPTRRATYRKMVSW